MAGLLCGRLASSVPHSRDTFPKGEGENILGFSSGEAD